MTRLPGRAKLAALGAAVLGAGALVAVAGGLAGGAYVIDPSGVTSGGGRSTSTGYALQGAIGQPFAGVVQGSGFVLTNGVIPGTAADDVPSFRLFAPAVISNP